jgi:mRNA interferase RelE/StbE
MYSVVLSDTARHFYDDADGWLQRKLDRCFEVLKTTPRAYPNIKPLKGQWAGHYRFRIGEYRVVYSIDDAGRVVIVAIIAHRSKVYE